MQLCRRKMILFYLFCIKPVRAKHRTLSIIRFHSGAIYYYDVKLTKSLFNLLILERVSKIQKQRESVQERQREGGICLMLILTLAHKVVLFSIGIHNKHSYSISHTTPGDRAVPS